MKAIVNNSVNVGHMLFGVVILFALAAGVQAKPFAPGFKHEVISHFVAASERSKDPYYQYTMALKAYESADFESASRIFLELSKAGHTSAQYYLAVMYDAGLGVEEDHVMSAMWYQKAAKKGHTEAQYNLAVAYATGEGIPQNMRKSVYWMKKAALRGNVNSQYNLGLIYILGNGVKTNLEEGVFWWKLAAKNGDSVAQFNLGMMYLEGRGVESDICEATRWWQISADNGFMQSKLALETLKHTHSSNNCLVSQK